MTFTIATWNLNTWQSHNRPPEAVWDHLWNDIGADVACVQESPVPPADLHAEGTFALDGGREWGTGVVSPRVALTAVSEAKAAHGSVPVQLTPSIAGLWTAVTLDAGGRELTLVSMYGRILNGYSYASVHRILADLEAVLDSPQLGKTLLLAGDLNLTTQWTGPNASYNPIEHALLAQFEAWGLQQLAVRKQGEPRLEACPCKDEPCTHVQTHWNKESTTPLQLDYVFASTAVAKTVESVDVASRTVNGVDLSDHAPVVVRLTS